MRHKKRLAALLLATLMLSGCTSPVPTDQVSTVTLPPPASTFVPANENDALGYAETVQLNLPSLSGGQLVMVSDRILIPPDQHPAEATLKRLLSFSGSDQAAPLFPSAQLTLQPGTRLELSGDVATVDLSANAALLSKQDLLTLSRALTNTLTQWQDIRYVNLLIAGRAPAMDERGWLPLGSQQQSRNEDAPALWDSYAARSALETPENQRFSSLCTLYYPAPSGRGILAEARAVSFPGMRLEQQALSLLEALSARAQTLPQAPQVPDLRALLQAEPELITFEGGRILSLQFLPIANETFIQAGVPRSVMLASLSYTLCGFLPDLSGIQVRIGNEQIEAIVPSGIYEGAGEQISFSGGLLRRADFSTFLLTDCTLYFARGEDALQRVRRPVPHALAHSKSYLLGQLMAGPQPFDSAQGTAPVLPQGTQEEDLLAVTKQDDAALVNWSAGFLAAAEGFSPARERQMVYAIVNTLCETRGIRRVRFYVGGQQPESFSGAVSLPGEFLFNPDIVVQ